MIHNHRTNNPWSVKLSAILAILKSKSFSIVFVTKYTENKDDTASIEHEAIVYSGIDTDVVIASLRDVAEQLENQDMLLNPNKYQINSNED